MKIATLISITIILLFVSTDALKTLRSCSFGYLYKDDCVKECPESTWIDHTSRTCMPCPPGCLECLSNSERTSCFDNYTLQNGTCEEEGANSSYSNCEIANCFECSEQNLCSTCQEGYILQDGICALVESPVCSDPNCVDCSLDSQTCNICKENYIMQDGICISSCHDIYCVDCSENPATCNACQEGYTIQEGVCIYTPPACNIANCIDCPEDPSVCNSCDLGFTLQNGICSPLSVYNSL